MITLNSTPAVQNFSGSFRPGAIHALIGGDGAGKTSLLKLLASEQTRNANTNANLSKNQVCFQPATSGVWRNLSVKENLEFIAQTFDIPKNVATQTMSQLIDAAGLTDATHRTASKLSGGMRQKLGVIMAMLPKPSLLLLDEPTTGVDPESRKTLWNLITQAAAEQTTVILATTYLEEAQNSDVVFLLNDGNLLASGSPEDVISAAPGVVWQQEIGKMQQRDLTDLHVWERGSIAYRWLADDAAPAAMSPATMDLELAAIATLLEHSKPQNKPFTPLVISAKPTTNSPLVSAVQVTKRFGSFTALHDISMHVSSGEIVGLIGGNGAGKSTLIRLLLGLDRPTEGHTTLFGTPPNLTTRARVGYVPQSLGLYPTLSPQQNLDFTTSVFTSDRKNSRFSDVKSRVKDLPLGAQRNIAVECALSHNPELLILDEPTSGMDPLSRMHLWKTLRAAAAAGIGILVTTHYEHEATQCHRLIHLKNGELM
ncbi:MAG: ATP-binding cassette domain-containing protein [Corynebacterium sp.]|nr:ATP-binding cassette domain-containing protein [Corynebacterium sp.]